jgi:hypothetical protein
MFGESTFNIVVNYMLKPFLVIFETFKDFKTATLTSKRNTETFGNNSCACGSDFDSIINDPLNTNQNSKTHFVEFFWQMRMGKWQRLGKTRFPSKVTV